MAVAHAKPSQTAAGTRAAGTITKQIRLLALPVSPGVQALAGGADGALWRQL